VNVQILVPAISSPGKMLKYPMGKELSKFLSRLGHCGKKKKISPPGAETPKVLESFSPYRSHYTNRARSILAQHATYLNKRLVDTMIFLLVFAWSSSVYTDK
jgi:hypothetical protein